MKIRQKQLNLFLRFLKFLLPFRKRWILILLLSGASMLLGLVNPYLAKFVVDEAFGGRNIRIFIIITLAGGMVFIVGGLVDGARQFLDRYINIKLGFDLNRKVFRKLQRFSYSWFQEKSTGENLYTLNYDVDRVTDFITTTPPQVVSLFPQIIITLVIVLFLNWQMALFALCLAPFLYIPPYYFSRKMRRVWETLIKNSQEVFKGLHEFFSHILLVKAFGKEAHGARKFLRQLIQNIRLQTSNVKLEIVSSFVGNFLSKLIIGLITFYGGLQVIKGQMTLGSFTAIMVYLKQLIGLQGQFAYFFQNIAVGLVSCERVAGILDRQEELDFKDAKFTIERFPRIDFSSVSFAYRKDDYILKDLTFCIDAGKHIVLAGPSGCGKTTVINLIMGLFVPLQGEIVLDGINLNKINRTALAKDIAIALQEPFLWDDTIENNIRYGRQNSTMNEIIRAAEFAGVDEFVKFFPQGYQTAIGENACKISEGQKQKIAIARALIKNPKILILDEAMSSMDSESEKKITSNIKQNFPGITFICVSHRLSAAMDADSVYYLENPQTITIETCGNLLRENHRFADLFAGQHQKETTVNK